MGHFARQLRDSMTHEDLKKHFDQLNKRKQALIREVEALDESEVSSNREAKRQSILRELWVTVGAL